MKKIFVPQLNRHVSFGRRRPKVRIPHMPMGRYLGALPPPPASVDYSKPAGAALAAIYGNDQLGDCVIAAGYHVVAVETANAGKLFTATAQQILTDYGTIGGYVPSKPETDNGCDEQTALNYWQQHGFADGTKLLGWLSVDAANRQQVEQALYLFENLFFGIELPDAWVNPFPAASGFTWDVGPPNPDNGHAVCGVGYGTAGVLIDTWGMLGTLTWSAISSLCGSGAGGELYTLLSPDQIAKGMQKAPNGFDWRALIADFDALGGKVPVPAPPPVPVPPAPHVAVSLQQAQAWAWAGLAAHWPK